ncbi:MAG: DNA primase DnaG [Thermoplasmata archaeon]|nr:DNA primase [Euryarchaeota archaeon]MVT14930.1 DNA primase [Euryarchaeota archaeon]MVT35214.1 DNA primase [Euryarchaeota archaeon]
MNIDPNAAKYLIKAKIMADGVVEKPDVVGAIFGQTEGLLGEELDLRDLQKSGRIGRIEVEIDSKKGKSEGIVYIPSSLDQVETAILAASLETIERVGPCKASFEVLSIEDIRLTKRQKVVERAKELLESLLSQGKNLSEDLIQVVRETIEKEEIITYGEDRLPAGPAVPTSDAIIIVEGRSDVLNLLKYGIKNAIAVEGTNIPKTIIDLTKERVATAFLDGDRGGDLIFKELLQVAEIDFVARAPPGREVEELTYKQIVKALRNKMTVEQYLATHGMNEELEKMGKSEMVKEAEKEEDRVEEKEEISEDRKKDDLLLDAFEKKVAFITDKEGNIISTIQLNELFDKLSTTEIKGNTLITGGIISQRLVDIAYERGIEEIYGMKILNVTKKPANMKLIVRNI